MASFEIFKDISGVAGFFAGTFGAVYAWFQTRSKTNDARHDAHDDRLTRLEHQVSGMPGKDDLHEIKVTLAAALARLEARMDAAQQAESRNSAMLDRIDAYLRGDRA